jgi:hypothetical protein
MPARASRLARVTTNGIPDSSKKGGLGKGGLGKGAKNICGGMRASQAWCRLGA